MTYPKPPSHVEVLPLRDLLRAAWNTKRYLTGNDPDQQPFLVEDSSRAHVERLNELMTSDADWCAIGLVTYLSQASDHLGQWGEGCPCEHHQQQEERFTTKRSGQRLRIGKLPDTAASCCFKCCRAPELAVGKALQKQSDLMRSLQKVFIQSVASAPRKKQAELTGAWFTASSKLFGTLSEHILSLNR